MQRGQGRSQEGQAIYTAGIAQSAGVTGVCNCLARARRAPLSPPLPRECLASCLPTASPLLSSRLLFGFLTVSLRAQLNLLDKSKRPLCVACTVCAATGAPKQNGWRLPTKGACVHQPVLVCRVGESVGRFWREG